MVKSRNRRKHFRIPRSVIAVIIVIVVILAAFSLFHGRNTGSTIPSTTQSTSNSPSSSSNLNKQSSPSSGGSSPSPSGSTDKSTGTTSGNAPNAPTGNFVSNHKPNLSGSPAPSQEQSACNTSPGATCYIEFTKSGVTKKLSAQATDSNGSVIWSWDVNKAGLTPGQWQVTAIATLNGQTASAQDQLPLDVQQ